MIDVKFRGEIANNSGQLVYGDLHHNQYTTGIYTPDYGGVFVQVYSDTVKQLVGYDINDKEVYEDDRLIDQDGNEWRIELHPVVVGKGEYGEDASHDLIYAEHLQLRLAEGDDND